MGGKHYYTGLSAKKVLERATAAPQRQFKSYYYLYHDSEKK